jgi:hypothetical protein
MLKPFCVETIVNVRKQIYVIFCNTLTLLTICSFEASMSPVYTAQMTLGNSFWTSRSAVQRTRSPPPPALLYN